MNKNAIKRFAIQARVELISAITQRAYELGITKDEMKTPEEFEGGIRVNEQIFNSIEKRQREELIGRMNQKGFEQVIEEVAYTWFNRLIALRFMEVNDYLPTGVRVLSSEMEGKQEPDLLTQITEVDLELDLKYVYQLQDASDDETLYKYVLIKQCNALHSILPLMFEKINDYTELLLPNNLLQEQSIIRLFITSVPEEDWKEEVEIIGWLYQYYITDKKDEVFTGLKRNKKISKENVPAATQLFTPKWIVEYMVENSLGRLWLEKQDNGDLRSDWKYFTGHEQQGPEIERELANRKLLTMNPEEITVLDPCMGSGHILVYAFDVLYQIYVSAGYATREIPRLILEKNVYGLDIDDRASQLAYFALMMKARSYSRRVFRDEIKVNITSIKESNGITDELINYFVGDGKYVQKDEVEKLVNSYFDAKEYGSIIELAELNIAGLESRVQEIEAEESRDLFTSQYRKMALEEFPPLLKQAKIMLKTYDVVITNPPYMGRKGMNPKLTNYIDTHYPKSKFDLFSVFIERGFSFTKEDGFNTFVTMQSWMFLSAYEKLRTSLLQTKAIVNLLHMDNMVMGIAFGTVAAVIRNKTWINYCGNYQFVTNKDIALDRPKQFPVANNKNKTVDQSEFFKIPSYPIAYWISSQLREAFSHQLIVDYSISEGQNVTGNNDQFVRMYWEVDKNEIGTAKKWAFYAKGGPYRKWYGNIEHTINWSEEARTHYRKNKICRIIPEYLWFRKGITWGLVTSGSKSFRMLPENATFDKAGSSIFIKEEKYYHYILGLLNSRCAQTILDLLNPTVSLQVKDVRTIPVIVSEDYFSRIDALVKENIQLCKEDWDSYETSADFTIHPVLAHRSDETTTFQEALQSSLAENAKRFQKLKENEEEINRLFIEIYGLENELKMDVAEEEVSIRLRSSNDQVRSFVSYAVGAMFGRFSLDEEGLIFAGGRFDTSSFKRFIPDHENIIPMTDDEYFEDDIVSKFVEFVRVSFGEANVEENLNVISNVLQPKGDLSTRQAIRQYFLKDFYKDHLQMYKKRPIYWQFDSGKQQGFQALTYMHRYEEGLVAQLRTEYLHTLQRKYEAEIERLNSLMDSDLSAREKNLAIKKQETIQKQLLECKAYDQIISHLANKQITLHLDDGVKLNYNLFQGVQVPQSEGKEKTMNALTDIKL